MRIHFIGIGGIGVSAIAQYYLAKGHQVSGSDLVSSEITDFLKEKGINIAINLKKFSKPDLVIYSPAVNEKNPELKFYKKNKIKCLSYPEALGELTKEHYTIAVSGTHGKSTTTAMIALVLEAAEISPTVIIGTKIKEFGNTNFKAGISKVLVIEADEHFASFLNYWPKVAVLTNIEADHLDFYKTLNKIIKTFAKYITHLQKSGFLVANEDDANIMSIIPESPIFGVQKYGKNHPDFEKVKKAMNVPGEHNVYNALATLEVARIMAVPDSITLKALSKFYGTWRRFDERAGKAGNKKIALISDYGHHPTEVLATLKACREKYPKKKIVCVFQPHQHQRTFYLFNDFVKIFKEAPVDKIIITDIYDVAGRETKKINKSISAKKLVKKVKKEGIIYLPAEKLEKYILENLEESDVLIIMGAGDIYNLAEKF